MDDSRYVEALKAAAEEHDLPKMVLFWGHKAKKNQSIGAWVLSQWWPALFEVDGNEYRTAEHFMMAEKARLFGDEEIRAQVLEAKTPGAAKALGRSVRGFVHEEWVAKRFEIVTRGNFEKFSRNEDLGSYLASTGERVLVEASPVDRIWGTGLAKGDPGADDPRAWKGLNLLGFALMEARSMLAEQR